jgi:hypothetical protein
MGDKLAEIMSMTNVRRAGIPRRIGDASWYRRGPGR